MSKKYKLVSTAGINSEQARPLDEFTEEDFSKFEDGTLADQTMAELQQMAAEDQHFEWWIEEDKD